MPHSKININEASEFLHIPLKDMQYLVSRQNIPFHREKDRVFFIKSEIKEWATRSLFNDKNKKLGKNHFSPKEVWSKLEITPKRLSEYLIKDSISVNLMAKTRPSLLRELVNLAEKSFLIYDTDKLYKLLNSREDEHSTGLTKGIAIPHPKIHHHDIFRESFLVIAMIPGGIPFGSIDGEKSDLFFMPLASSDYEHIFMISRLAAMIKKTNLGDRLRKTNTINEVIEIFQICENEIL